MKRANSHNSWQTNSMEYVNTALRLLAASQIFLFCLLIALSINPKRVRVVGVLLAFGIMSYLVLPPLERYTPYGPQVWTFWYFAATSPSMLLLFTWFIFEENCRTPLWMLVIVAFSMLASLWFHYIGVGLPGSPIWLQILKAFIAALAAYLVWRGRDNDLVELRSKVRVYFIFSLALITFVLMTILVITDFNPSFTLDSVTTLVVFLYSLALNYFFIKLNPTVRLIAAPEPAKQSSEDPVVQQLLERMQSERLYANHDLRVASLASMMNVPEYKLRKKINQQLGYRNFNQFVNRYRIEEAGVKLRENARTPVLSIALDVGFRSISSFNSAFQTQFGISPTQYRAEATGQE